MTSWITHWVEQWKWETSWGLCRKPPTYWDLYHWHFATPQVALATYQLLCKKKKTKKKPSISTCGTKQDMIWQGMWVSFSCFSSSGIYIWLVCGSATIKRTNTIRHVFKRDCTMSSDFINYSTPNSAHSCEDLCIQLRTHQTCTSNNHH